MPLDVFDGVEGFLHQLGMHGVDAAFTLAALLVGAAFAGNWAGMMIAMALRHQRGKRRRQEGTWIELTRKP